MRPRGTALGCAEVAVRAGEFGEPERPPGEGAPRTVRLVALLQRDDGRVLLLRSSAGLTDTALLAPPDGEVRRGESLSEAMRREVAAHVGVAIDPEGLEFCQLIDVLDHVGRQSLRVAFMAQRWQGEPRNCEPHRCAQLVWADPGAPPPDCAPSTLLLLGEFVRAGLLVTSGYTAGPARVALGCPEVVR